MGSALQSRGRWRLETTLDLRAHEKLRLRGSCATHSQHATLAPVPTPAKETVPTFLDSWLEGTRSSLRPRTFVSYSQIVRDHVKPTLGRIPLARLQPQQVQQLYAQLLSGGRAKKTVRNVHVTLHRALAQAQRWRLVPTNVADLIDPPRVPLAENQGADAVAGAQGSRSLAW